MSDVLHVILAYCGFFFYSVTFVTNTVLYLEHQQTDLTLVTLDSRSMKQIHGELVEETGIRSLKKA